MITKETLNLYCRGTTTTNAALYLKTKIASKKMVSCLAQREAHSLIFEKDKDNILCFWEVANNLLYSMFLHL